MYGPQPSGEMEFKEPGFTEKLQDYFYAVYDKAAALPKWFWIIAVIVLVFLVYWFFIRAAPVNVTIEIVDTERELLSDIERLEVFKEGDREPLYSITNPSDSESVELREGKSYDVKVKKSKYKISAGSSIDEASAGTHTVKLKRDIKVDMSLSGFPTQIVKGQEIEARLTLVNQKGTPVTVSLVFEDSLDDVLDIRPEPETVELDPDIPAEITLKIGVKDTVEVEDDKEGDEYSAGDIRIRGSTEKVETSDFKVLPEPEIEVDLSKTSIEIDQGDYLDEIKIDLENKSKFPVSGIQYSFDITSSNNPGASQWFSFQPSPPIDLAERRASGDEQTVRLLSSLPISVKSDTITIETHFFTSYWDSGPQVTTIYVRPKTLIGLSTEDLSAKAGQSDATQLKIKNNAEQPLRKVLITKGCADSGGIRWEIVGSPSIDEIVGGATKSITVNIKTSLSTWPGIYSCEFIVEAEDLDQESTTFTIEVKAP